ncbi:MAG: hypothetical protein ACREMZ_10245 [Gemmatimonadales bacterium]
MCRSSYPLFAALALAACTQTGDREAEARHADTADGGLVALIGVETR